MPPVPPTSAPPSEIRVAVLQRVLTGYRLELFRRLSARRDLRVRTFVGEDIPATKVRNTADFGDLDVVELPTRVFHLGRRVQPWHRGLYRAIAVFRPDAILCEAESHFLAYLAAAAHRVRRGRDGVAMVQWGLGGLPGLVHRERRINRLKVPFHGFSDVFLVYSSYGAGVMRSFGHPADRVLVAVNVADTERHVAAADALLLSASAARERLELPDRFTVLSVGALDANKRPEVLVEAAAGLDPARFNVLVVGGGPMLEELRDRVRQQGLTHLFLPGPVDASELPLYYRASNAVVLPGRGGMVISEAMAHRLPVVVHLADGTEYDLVRTGETGVRLESGEPEDFRGAIEELASDPERAAQLGAAGRALVEDRYSMNAMVERIADSIHKALAIRRGDAAAG